MTREIKIFQNYLSTNKNLSNNTIDSYTFDLIKLENYVKSINKTLLNINNDDIDDFIKTLTLKTSSYNRLITSITLFYKYLISINYNININVSKIEHVKNDKIYPKIISFDDIRKMISCNENTILGNRNKTILTMLYITGLRVSELINLTYNDINFNEGYIRCLGKGNKEKIIVVGDLLSITLNDYTNNVRKKILSGLHSKYIFVNSEGEPLTRQTIYDIVKECKNKANIKLKVTPHTFRHCFATHMLENGADIRSVQEMLGHSDISTTQIYLNIAKTKLKEDYFKKFKDPMKKEEYYE